MSTKTTGAYVDQTNHELLLRKFNENKKYKEKLLKEITADICAMLNSNGGKVVINIDADSNDMPSQMSTVVRTVEQHLTAIIGTNIASHIDIAEDEEPLTISVKKADSLITVDYHLYLPSQKQVIQVPPSEPQEKVKNDIVNRNAVHEPVKLGSHKKTFFKSKKCGLLEKKTVQLKNLKAGASKCSTLADRMIGKSNKFSCYVSAFANYKGGHIYYGIHDNGIVAGEFIPNEVDKEEILKKVEKSINKMIWPEQPKRKVHWEISFEPVLDDNSAPISSTFVIVIYIAPCLGCVFTEDPECYEMVKGKVVKMSFSTWKERILKPIQLDSVSVPDSTMKRLTWSSSRIQKICSRADELLIATINDGKSIDTISNNLLKKYPDVIELRLLILAKRVMANYRTCSFSEARKVLDEYDTSLRTATELWMFYAIQVYLEIAIRTAQGDVEAVNNILPEASGQAEVITPGRISAALYLNVAYNCLQQKGDDDNSPAKFAIRALEDLQHVQEFELLKVRADMEQKAHLTLAMFYLGCDRFGLPTKKDIDSVCLKKAESSIMAVHQSIYDGNLMSPYREVQFIIVQSILFYRKSQVQPGRKRFLEAAIESLKKAETHATACNFQDIKYRSRKCMALFTHTDGSPCKVYNCLCLISGDIGKYEHLSS